MKKIYQLVASAIFICLLSSVSLNVFSQVKRTQTWSINSGTNDAEEAMPGGSGTVGAMDLTSSDLEIMLDGTKKQIIGLRFTNISIPQGATINKAYVQFANKGDKAPVLGDAVITAEDADNGAVFTSTAFNISTRIKVPSSVVWSGSTSTTWGTTAAGVAGADQRTPDIKNAIQPVINRAGWIPGNALVILITGEGVRNTYSYDGSAEDTKLIPKLIVEYTAAVMPPMAVTNFPLTINSEWKYLDDGTNQGTAWTLPAFNDDLWNYGAAKLGYSDNAVTTLSYGPNSSNKYITYYFRKKFNITDVSILPDTVKLNILRDDGAIVYINGTEVVRSNMPAGAIDHLTFSSTIVDGVDESAYFSYLVPKSVLVSGSNTIAVEIHQRDGTSSDLGFDLSLLEYQPALVPVPCAALPASHISNFVSVLPSAQPDSLRIPSTHTFQMLLQSGDPYTNPADGLTKSTFDFTGYVPIAGSSTNGYLSINHEQGAWPAAGVSMLSLNYVVGTQLWNITNNVPVDFSGVAGTGRNCSGTVTPWNTIITSEETLPTADANGDGYQDIGWNVEIDPATHAIVDYNNDGTADKMWKLGRMSHENVVATADSLTIYEGNDENPGYIFKMIANAPGKFGSGNLYVLKLSGTVDNSSTGTWILVPNGTPAECNNVRAFAASVAATNFNSIEDVEINPKDGKVYFTSKASSRVYRFKDLGMMVNAFDIFVGNAGTLYNINYGTGTAAEQWRDGNDNLTFDNEGNLYVIQDGGRNHVWMVRPCHSAANPQVELFAVTPAGSEPTGMTFSPDYKFMFLSIQHPNGTNLTAMKDAAGNQEIFNKESAIVIARKEFLGVSSGPLPISFYDFVASRTSENKSFLEWKFFTNENTAKFEVQRMVSSGAFETIQSITKNTSGLQQDKHSFIDQKPYAGKNFYRIKAIQKDGREVYTNIKMVDIDFSDKLHFINSYPNPADVTFNLVFETPIIATADIKVINALNIEVLQKRTSVIKGVNNLQLDIKTLAAGVYFVVINVGNETIRTSLVKQ